MGRAPCCDKANVKKGPWSPEEDTKLKDFIHKYGTGGNWIALPQKAGLKRCGKSCRLRWLNYLRPNIKHGEFSDDEDRIICTLFATIGSRWSIIAAQLPGRTDNDIKNYWNTKLKKKLLGILPNSQRQINHQQPSQSTQPITLESFPPTISQDFIDTNMPFSNANPTLFQDPSLNQYLSIQGNLAEQSSSSSDVSYGKEFEGYLYANIEENQKLLLGNNEEFNYGAPPLLEYGAYEEIKNMISPSNYNINGFSTQERDVMYHF